MSVYMLGIAVVGAGVTIYGQQSGAREEQKRGNFLAAQYQQNAGQRIAASQREAEEQRRKGRLVASRAQALAGGGASDESVVKTISDISAEGEYRALTALYEGDSEAQDMRLRGDLRVMEGGSAKKAADIQSVGTVFSTGSSLYSKYGGN